MTADEFGRGLRDGRWDLNALVIEVVEAVDRYLEMYPDTPATVVEDAFDFVLRQLRSDDCGVRPALRDDGRVLLRLVADPEPDS